jgi:hypothetical protein
MVAPQKSLKMAQKYLTTNKMLTFLLLSILNSAFVESNPSNPAALISQLCATKTRSPACEIEAKCPSSSLLCDSQNAYSILYEMCLSDFKSNPTCSDVISYCASNQASCATIKDISTLPTAANATAAIFSICYEMPQMAACSICPPPDVNTKISDCPLLQTYSDHCTEMPDMSQCLGYTKFCSSVGKDLSFCTGDTGSNSGSVGSSTIPTKYCGPSDSFCVIGSRGKTSKSTCFTVHSKSTGWFGLGLGSQMLGKIGS